MSGTRIFSTAKNCTEFSNLKNYIYRFSFTGLPARQLLSRTLCHTCFIVALSTNKVSVWACAINRSDIPHEINGSCRHLRSDVLYINYLCITFTNFYLTGYTYSSDRYYTCWYAFGSSISLRCLAQRMLRAPTWLHTRLAVPAAPRRPAHRGALEHVEKQITNLQILSVTQI